MWKREPADKLSALKIKQAIWENRFLSDEALSKLNFENGELCIYCGESTECGSGSFVNRIPASRHIGVLLLEGYQCATCQSPPLCEECEMEPSEDGDWRCKKCNELLN